MHSIVFLVESNYITMNRSYLKLIIGGILLGVAIYFVPFFVLKVIAFMLILGFLGWLFGGRRHHHRHHYWAMADRIRQMSDEDYDRFKKERSMCRHGWYHHNTEKND